MMTMEPLVTTKRGLIWLCGYSLERNTSIRKRLAYFTFTVIILVSLLLSWSLSFCYIMRFILIDLEGTIYALFENCVVISVVYVLITIYLMRFKNRDVFESLANIYNKYTKDEAFQYLQNANKTSERFWSLYSKFALYGYVLCIPLMALFSVLICWILYKTFDVNYLYHPFNLVAPWNSDVPLGYFYEIIFIDWVGICYLFVHGTVLIYFMSVSVHQQAFSKMFQHFVSELNTPQQKQNKKVLLCKWIRFHTITKSWFLKTTEVFSPIIMAQLFAAVIFLACLIFQIDLISDHLISFQTTILLFLILNGSSNLFLYCYFGKVATESFLNMSDYLFECDWQKLPIELQKCLIIMIGNSQKKIYYHGFGLAVLRLETFTKMLRTAFSYYMVFKSVTSH